MVRNCKGKNKDGQPCGNIAGELVDGYCNVHLRGHYQEQIDAEVYERLKKAATLRPRVRNYEELEEDYFFRTRIWPAMVRQVVEERRAAGILPMDCLLSVLQYRSFLECQLH